MESAKPFWASKTLWGSVATCLGILLPSLGVGVSPTDISHAVDSLVNVLNDLLTFGGIMLTIYGRLVATKPVTLSK